MKRIYATLLLSGLLVLSAGGFVACSESDDSNGPQGPTVLTLHDTLLRISSEANTCTVRFSLENPLPGEQLRITTNSSWIRIVRTDASSFTLVAEENTGVQRSSLLTLKYAGLAPQRVQVVQAAYGCPIPETDQTVLFYLSGQSLLSYFRDTNVAEIRKEIGRGTTLYNSRVLVFIQPSTQQSLLIEYAYDTDSRECYADTLCRYSDFQSIRQEDIVRVFRDMQKKAPANRYGLVMGSHGGGWVPARYKNLTQNENGSDENEWSLRACGQTERTDWLGRIAGADATRWFGEDNYTTADIETWSAAFDEAAIDWEYVIFDACFMSNIETLYELRRAARYIVGSPCEIMGRGMPYATMLADLFTDEGRNYDLESFCRHFYDFYSTTTATRKSGCIALTVCEELEALAERMKPVNAKMRADADFSKVQVYEGLSKPLFFDLLQYIETGCTDAEAVAAFRTQFDRTFPEACRLHTPSFYSGYNGRMNDISYYSGVTTSAPSEKFPTACAATAWSQATR